MPHKDPVKAKEYHSNWSKEHYRKNKDAYLERNARREQAIREQLADFKRTLSCKICGEDHPYCLEFHHIDRSEKEHNIADMVKRGYSIKRIKEEIDKCDVLCANCHRKVHHPIDEVE